MTVTRIYHFALALFVALFISVQTEAVVHASAELDHTHHCDVCVVSVLADQGTIAVAPADTVLFVPVFVTANAPTRHIADIPDTHPPGRAPPPRSPPLTFI